MKKDRNSFFNEASYSYGGYIPTNNMMQPNMMPVQSGQYNQSFYSGPGFMGQTNNTMDMNDIGYFLFMEEQEKKQQEAEQTIEEGAEVRISEEIRTAKDRDCKTFRRKPPK